MERHEALIEVLRGQRNMALDSLAQVNAELVLAQARVAQLEKQLQETSQS